jgi:hypothetical protein
MTVDMPASLMGGELRGRCHSANHEIELRRFEQTDRLGNVGCDDGERIESRQVRDGRLSEEGAWVGGESDL